MGSGTRVRLKYIQEFRDKTGHVRRYFRRPGSPRIPLPGRPGSPEFMAAYNEALAGIGYASQPLTKSAPGSVSATLAAYYTDNTFLALAESTQRARRSTLERFRSHYGQFPIVSMEQKHVTALLGKMRPFAARNWLAALRGLMQFAKRIGLRPDDPTHGVEMVRAKVHGFHTWTEDEIAVFEAAHPIGTRARLAMAILLYTAARRGDMVRLGPQHIRAERLTYRQQKTGRVLSIPVHPALSEILASSRAGISLF